MKVWAFLPFCLCCKWFWMRLLQFNSNQFWGAVYYYRGYPLLSTKTQNHNFYWSEDCWWSVKICVLYCHQVSKHNKVLSFGWQPLNAMELGNYSFDVYLYVFWALLLVLEDFLPFCCVNISLLVYFIITIAILAVALHIRTKLNWQVHHPFPSLIKSNSLPRFNED